MLIIFDLDDTLIDTSGSLTPIKLKKAFERMLTEGLSLANPSEAWEELRQMNAGAESSREALIQFLSKHKAPVHLLNSGLNALYQKDEIDFFLEPRRDAIEVLNKLAPTHTLAIVTAGHPDYQHNKMKKAGIDFAIFSKIIVCEQSLKKTAYQAIVQELDFLSEDVMVCGDRIKGDLTPARELGFTTIHMRWGRGLNTTGSQDDVDYSIHELTEILSVISTFIGKKHDHK